MNLKVTVAQITSDPGCFETNFDKIRSVLAQAQQDSSQLVIFPELAICGYTHLDLAKRQTFIKDNQKYLQQILPFTVGLGVIIGFIEADYSDLMPDGTPNLYNAAAIIENQKIKTIVRKQLLPTYDIFFEERYYTPSKITKPVELCGIKIGVGICEDLWDQGYDQHIYQTLLAQGAELLVNISASPFEPGKIQQRLALVQALGSCPFIYTNLVGSFDGYEGEVVFDGQSFIADQQGQLQYLAPACQEASATIDLSSTHRIQLPNIEVVREIYQALVLGVKEYFRRCNLKRAYLGLSGGIDSALVAALATAALGAENVIGVTMPSAITSEETRTDAHLLAKNLGIKIEERPIKHLYQVWLDGFIAQQGKEPESLTRQNIQARFRGMTLMEYTNEDRAGLVLSTGNKTELALGYCTIYGDMCGGLAVIADLNKMVVYQLSKYINQLNQREIIPVSTIKRVPTAELELGQTDVANLPADYDVLSPLVDELLDQNLSPEELGSKYRPEVVQKVCWLMKINEFKRRQAAPGIRVSRKAFGVGRRMPISHGSY